MVKAFGAVNLRTNLFESKSSFGATIPFGKNSFDYIIHLTLLCSS